MVASVQDVLKTNMVLVGVGLLNASEEVSAFTEAVGTDVVLSGAGIAFGIPAVPPESGRVLTLNRDRIALELFPSRSTIGREYPTYEELDRLAQVADYAISKTDSGSQELKAFGYNVELVYSQDSGNSSLRYLGDRLFAPNIPSSEGWVRVGGAGRMIFESNGARWMITVEPRFNDEAEARVFLSLNLHIAKQTLPEEAEIKASLQQAWKEAHNFTAYLDQRVP